MIPKFFFGVWAQPTASLLKWKAMGMNLIFPDTTEPLSPQARRKACADLGLFYIDTMTDVNDTSLLTDPYCVGVYPDDEPSNNAPWYAADPIGFQKFVSAWQAKWNPILSLAKGKKPIYVNFAGGHVTAARPWHLGQQVQPFGALADIVSCDLYPFDPTDIWTPWLKGIGLPNDPLAPNTTIQQYATRLLKEYFPGKQVWGYIQTCQFDKASGARGPIADEIEAQVQGLLKENVGGIVTFVDNLTGPGWNNAGGAPGSTNWDGETFEEAAKVKAIAQRLTAIDPYQIQIDEIKSDLKDMKTMLRAIAETISSLK